MQVDNKILDDLAKVAGGAIGALTGLKDEVEAQMRRQFERILGQMDVVSRDEFEAARATAIKAREEQETLAERVAALEAQMATLLAERTLAHAEPGPKRPAPGHHGATTAHEGAKATAHEGAKATAHEGA